jgi:hypothetical protein
MHLLPWLIFRAYWVTSTSQYASMERCLINHKHPFVFIFYDSFVVFFTFFVLFHFFHLAFMCVVFFFVSLLLCSYSSFFSLFLIFHHSSFVFFTWFVFCFISSISPLCVLFSSLSLRYCVLILHSFLYFLYSTILPLFSLLGLCFVSVLPSRLYVSCFLLCHSVTVFWSSFFSFFLSYRNHARKASDRYILFFSIIYTHLIFFLLIFPLFLPCCYIHVFKQMLLSPADGRPIAFTMLYVMLINKPSPDREPHYSLCREVGIHDGTSSFIHGKLPYISI